MIGRCGKDAKVGKLAGREAWQGAGGMHSERHVNGHGSARGGMAGEREHSARERPGETRTGRTVGRQGAGSNGRPGGALGTGEAGEHSGAGAGGHVIREAGGMRGARERVRGGQGVREKREHSGAEFREARKLEF